MLVFLIVLAVIALLLLLPVSAVVYYQDGLFVKLKILFINIIGENKKVTGSKKIKKRERNILKKSIIKKRTKKASLKNRKKAAKKMAAF